MENEIPCFVITGGPCAGKSSGLSMLMQKLQDFGMHPFVVPELATLLFTNGINIKTIAKDPLIYREFQKRMLLAQIALENEWREFAEIQPAAKKVLICDRGVMDQYAYIDVESWKSILRELNYKITELRDKRYDAVFHLVTAAKGAESFYNLTNPARYESIADARVVDEKIIEAWIGHEHFRIIPNSEIKKDETVQTIDFDQKMKRLIKEVCRALHIPAPLEIERAFLVDKNVMPQNFGIPIDYALIRQTYLVERTHKVTRRIREREPVGLGSIGGIFHTYTEKKKLRPGVREERERVITEREYNMLLADKDPHKQMITKHRHSFVWQNQYFQLDLLQTPQELALLEIEITEEQDKLKLPPFIKITKEVTDDNRYRNSAIAEGKCPGYD